MNNNSPLTDNKQSHLTFDRSDWMAILAVFISVGAFAVSIYEANIMKQQQQIMHSQQQASVWPYMESKISLNIDSAYSSFSIQIDNQGVGPAKIKSFQMFINGEEIEDYSTIGDVMEKIWDDDIKMKAYSYSPPKGVIASNDSKQILEIKRSVVGLDFFDLDKMNITFTLCYCSIYDQCWTVTEQNSEPLEGC